MSKKHYVNCLCGDCTSGDPYIMKLKNSFGKNANFSNTYNGGRQASNNADDPEPWLGGPSANQSTTANVKKIFGDALGNVLGNLIQAKKDGETLPPLLDKVAGLGIQTEKAAIDAAQSKANSTVGAKVIEFSPYIIIGLVLLVIVAFIVLKNKR